MQQRWSKGELERQIQNGAALRAAPGRKEVSPALTRVHPAAEIELKDSYSAELLRRGARPHHRKLHELYMAAGESADVGLGQGRDDGVPRRVARMLAA